MLEENPYTAAGVGAGARGAIYDSFAEDFNNNVAKDIAKAKANDVYMSVIGEADYARIVDDVWVDHFEEIWGNNPTLVSLEDDEPGDNDIPNLIPMGKTYMELGQNVCLIGPHGTGKTFSIMGLVAEMGWKMAYYSCSTLDPYTDLVGVPQPITLEDGTKSLEMIRPHSIDQAEFIFFDEFNRADSQTMNAIFEICQFGTINGEKLPNLKCVWCAMNPVDGDYTVSETDPALLDRFDAYIIMEPKPSVAYLNSVGIDKKVAKVLVRWWNMHETKQKNQKLKKDRMSYISPRRLEKIGFIWTKTNSGSAVLRALPPNGEYDSKKLIDMLETASGLKDVGDAERAKVLGFPEEKAWIKAHSDVVGKTIKGDIPAQIKVIEILFKGSGPSVIREDFSLFITKYCSASAVETALNNQGPTKKSNIKAEFMAYKDHETVKDTLIARALGI